MKFKLPIALLLILSTSLWGQGKAIPKSIIRYGYKIDGKLVGSSDAQDLHFVDITENSEFNFWSATSTFLKINLKELLHVHPGILSQSQIPYEICLECTTNKGKQLNLIKKGKLAVEISSKLMQSTGETISTVRPNTGWIEVVNDGNFKNKINSNATSINIVIFFGSERQTSWRIDQNPNSID